MNITKIIQIGFFENKIKQIQAVKMPKTIQKVPHVLPKLITSSKQMFEDIISFNQDISSWNVAKVKNMSGMFAGTKAFDQNLSTWNVKNVTTADQLLARQ